MRFFNGLFKSIFIICFLIFQSKIVHSNHLAGGEIILECNGNGQFNMTLYQYRDCNDGGLIEGNNDLSSIILIVDLDNPSGNYDKYEFDKIEEKEIPPNDLGPCLDNNNPVCINRATFSGIINLPQNINGYKIINQRCCRNNGISNINDPSSVGSTYQLFVSQNLVRDCNFGNTPLSLKFNQFPSIQLCALSTLEIDHSATMSFSDTINYSICTPFNGGSPDEPAPTELLPYSKINYDNGFSEFSPLGITSTISIDSSGKLSVNPEREGRYMVGICAEAYKNGSLYGSIQRDFQFNVYFCEGPTAQTDAPSYKNCIDSTITFKSLSVANNYFWDFGVASISTDTSFSKEVSFTYPDSGTYYVKHFINVGEQCEDSVEVPVFIYPTLGADFNVVETCIYDSTIFNDASFSSYNDIIQWSWDLGNGNTAFEANPKALFTIEGFYDVTLAITTKKGCQDTIQKEIEAYPIPTADFNNNDACLNINYTFENLSNVPDGIQQQFWQINNSPISSDENPNYIFNSIDTFLTTLIVQSNNNCFDTISKSIIVRPPIKSDFITSSDTICSSQIASFINNSSGYLARSEWLFGDGTSSNLFEPVHVYSVAGNYQVQLNSYSAVCPADSIKKIITVKPTPDASLGNNRDLCDGTVEYIKVNNRNNGNVLWSTGATTDSIPITNQLTRLNVRIEKDGCTNSDFIYISNKCDVYIPTAFAPDGVNNTFNVIDENIKDYTLSIFDKWGECIFSTNSFDVSWDGTYRNKPMTMDKYIYAVEGHKEDGTYFKLRGSLVLLR